MIDNEKYDLLSVYILRLGEADKAGNALLRLLSLIFVDKRDNQDRNRILKKEFNVEKIKYNQKNKIERLSL